MKTLFDRINKKGIMTKKGKIHLYYNSVFWELSRLTNNGYKSHPLTWYGGNTRLQLDGVSFLAKLEYVLNLLGIEYDKGNDAPRRGANGTFIQITDSRQRAKARRQFNTIKQYL